MLIVALVVRKFSDFHGTPNFHCCVYRSPLLDPVLIRLKAVHTLTYHSFKAHFNIVLPPKSRLSKYCIVYCLQIFRLQFSHLCHACYMLYFRSAYIIATIKPEVAKFRCNEFLTGFIILAVEYFS